MSEITQLPLKRTVLLTLEMVRAARGLHARHIRHQLDEGKLQWVWNISAGRGRCAELRFWAREVIAPELCILLSPLQVIGMVLGAERQVWGAADLEALLLCSKQHVHALLRSDLKEPGAARRGRKTVTRATLERFFLNRLAN